MAEQLDIPVLKSGPESEETAPTEAVKSDKPKRKPKEPVNLERDLGKSFFPVSRVQKILKADKVRPPRVGALYSLMETLKPLHNESRSYPWSRAKPCS